MQRIASFSRYGQAVGSGVRADGTDAAVIWTGSRLTEAKPLHAGHSVTLLGVNRSGQAVGYGYGPPSDGRLPYALTWIGGVPQRLDLGGIRTEATHINEAGQILLSTLEDGDITLPPETVRRTIYLRDPDGAVSRVVPPEMSGDWNARVDSFSDRGHITGTVDPGEAGNAGKFYWYRGSATSFSGITFEAHHIGVNNRGQVAGTSGSLPDWDAFRWQDGTVDYLGDLGQGTGYLGGDLRRSINDRGDIIGTVSRTPFVWSEDDVTFLGTPGRYQRLAAINNSRQVAGTFRTGDDPEDPDAPHAPDHAVLWRYGRPTDLGVPDGYRNSEAMWITEGGAVLGVASGGTAARDCAFRWVVKPLRRSSE